MSGRNSKLIYTTDPAEAKRLRESGAMPEGADVPSGKQRIRVSLDRKRRRGKTVTVASGFELTPATLENLAKELKKRCGAGGKAAAGEIEIQGDHAESIRETLRSKGFRVE